LRLVKKFPEFNGTRRFITALTGVQQLSLSWAKSIHSIYRHHISWRSILILYNYLRLCLPNGFFDPGFTNNLLYTSPLLSHTRHIPSPSHSFESIIPQYRVKRNIYLTILYAISSIPCFLLPPRSKYTPQHNVVKKPSVFFPPAMAANKIHNRKNNRQIYSSMYLVLKYFASNLEDKRLCTKL